MGVPFQTVYAVVIDSRDRIVVAGTAGYSGQHEFALARYKPNGRLDRSFSVDGRVTTNFPGGDTSALGVAIDSHGRIVAAGYTGDYPDWDGALARYKPNGARDRSFGTGGKVITDFVATSVAIDSHDRIVVAGSGLGDLDSDFLIARYHRDGNLDPAFGTGGEVTTDFGGSDGASSIAIGSHGRIVTAGDTSPPSGGGSEFALARYTRDGSLDASFGAGGKVITDFRGRQDGATSVAIDSRGRTVAVGSTADHRIVYHGSAGSRFALARYKPNGHLDRSFSHNGKVSKPHGAAQGGAIDSRDRIVAAGVNAYRFALARYFG
jgi:uncharacterized delta-60 repeat protein